METGCYPDLANDSDRLILPENPCYRIPALGMFSSQATHPERLVAGFDIRPDFRDLPGAISLGFRFSDNFGTSWSPLHILKSATAGWGFGDASLISTSSGELLALFVGSRGRNFWDDSTPGENWKLLQARTHDGINWDYSEITSQLWNSDTGSMFFASGNGVELQEKPYQGRLLQPVVWRSKKSTMTFAGVVFSDDGGQHWQLPYGRESGTIPGIRKGDESKIVELPGGDILMSSRDYPERKWAISHDGGESFGEAWSEVPDPGCNGGLSRTGTSLVLTSLFPTSSDSANTVCEGSLGASTIPSLTSRLTLPLDPSAGKSAGHQDWSARRNLVMRHAKLSTLRNDAPDSGVIPAPAPAISINNPHIAWQKPEVIYPDAAAYSVSLSQKGRTAVLFECGKDSPYGSIGFTAILTTYGT